MGNLTLWLCIKKDPILWFSYGQQRRKKEVETECLFILTIFCVMLCVFLMSGNTFIPRLIITEISYMKIVLMNPFLRKWFFLFICCFNHDMQLFAHFHHHDYLDLVKHLINVLMICLKRFILIVNGKLLVSYDKI